MRRAPVSSILAVSLSLGVAIAADALYINEFEIWSSLAPCAKNAVSYNIQSLTYSKCPTAASELQSCVCTKNNNLASINSAISSSVSYSCGSTATEDQASAQTVLSAYCSQDTKAAFPTPAPVNAYVTEIAEVKALAPCAASALGYGVASLTYSNCPSEAPALASCACSKLGMSAAAVKLISSSARYSCSSHTADVSSAIAFFDAYCAMGNGTSAFPKPTNPPGDMTYYITDLPQYSSMARCAQSAVSYAVQWQTDDLCPEGPMALASCACLKDGMTKDILSSISSNVRYSCESTATDDISSAVGVYNFYCSAAQAQVVASGVTASVSQVYPAGTPMSGSRTGSGPQATGTGGTSGASKDGSGGDGKGSGKTNIALIAGVVVGIVVVLAAIGALVFFLRKNAQKKKQEQLSSDQVPMTGRPSTSAHNEYYNGKQELPADSVATMPPPSPSPSTLKPGNLPPRADTVSPLSAHNSAFSPPANHAELSGQAPPLPPMPNSAELPGQASPYPPMPQGAELPGQASPYPPKPHGAELQGQAPPYSPAPNTAELYGQGAAYQQPPRPELQGQGAMYPPQNRPDLQGQGAMYPPQNQGQGSPYPGPFRQELAGGGQYNNYPPQQPPNNYPPQQPVSPPQAYSPYSPQPPISPPTPYGQPSPHQQVPPPMPGMGWQSGPIVHEMDGGSYGQAK